MSSEAVRGCGEAVGAMRVTRSEVFELPNSGLAVTSPTPITLIVFPSVTTVTV